MASIPLLLMGCGGVGRQLLHHVISCRPLHSQQGVRLRVVGVCDSKSMVAIPDVLTSEFRDDFLLQLCEIKSNGSSFLDLTKTGECQVYSGEEIGRKVIDVATALSSSSGLALIDCSASSETIGLLSQVINLDGCVVLANKKPLTSPLEYYDKLVSQPRRLRHESTVGAGLPVIATINRMLSSGDPINRIIGSLSGTLGYVMSEVEGGRPFSEVVTSAKKLGFTEPDPRDDLGGMDVARKALILARLLGHRIELDSIKVESLYPEKMGPANIPLDEFLANGLPLLDEAIQKRIESAASNGNVLRYVCLIEESRCEVGLQEVSKDSALGRLQGSDNVVEIYSRCYSKQPLVIQGAGAGNDTTAVGVLADILDIQDMFRHSPSAA
ncbi:homoserine dehydrogenase-like isoform X1 [Salvia splendens]|uniref:homoserine dehydrogenase-like isoform X1 n=1 Tax=Salvia splendens TaxID=180675 RepID=UPI001C27174F|nr:homoserine dehydrogenase-like isoform X1 [Salvia splendens]